ncbi:MAG: pantoate--beta-alanine ligase [Bacteroidia bacterium]
MHIFKTISQLSDFRFHQARSSKQFGFIPTMGALHQGHASLVKRSVEENDLTIVSIFVNPTQFNESEDYTNYPRTEETDIQLLETIKPDVLFMPSADEMYQSGEELFNINLKGLDTVMEGKYREGHFQGVVTIVSKFFDIIRPNRAYFGLKDFQQLTIIKHLAEQVYPEMQIVPCAIIRENDGLAMSSRNQRLTETDREHSVLLSKTLFYLESNWRKMPFKDLLDSAKKMLSNSEINLEYLEVVDVQSLDVQHDYADIEMVACLAARVGKVRLIDNILLPLS